MIEERFFVGELDVSRCRVRRKPLWVEASCAADLCHRRELQLQRAIAPLRHLPPRFYIDYYLGDVLTGRLVADRYTISS